MTHELKKIEGHSHAATYVQSTYVAEYIEQLKRQITETREEAENWRNNITPPTEAKLLFSWENIIN